MLRVKFFSAVLLFLISFVLQARFLAFFDWSPNLMLAALLTAVFFLEFLEILLLALFAAWLLNWQPGVSAELLFFLLLPLFFFALARFSPWRRWLSAVVATIAGITLLYLGRDYSSFLVLPHLVFADILFSVAFGMLLYQILRLLESNRPLGI